MRGTFLLLFALSAPSLAQQSIVQGNTSANGSTVVNSLTSQYLSIYVVFPPTNTDNSSFVMNVMPQSAIDGVTVQLSWANIEMSEPDTTPCSPAPSDTCQPDPVVPMYHHYVWNPLTDGGLYDSRNFPGIWTWFDQYSGVPKKVNLLLNGEAAGNPNAATPHYVTESSWISLFTTPYAPSSSYARQDVINVMECSGVPWTGTVPSGSVTSGSTVTVNDTSCCSMTSTQSNVIQTGDLVWVNVVGSSACSTTSAGTMATVNNSGQFYYTPQGSCSGSISNSNVTYISAIQSWPVPYEWPYKAALQALWAATFAHFNSNYTAKNAGGTSVNVGKQLGYIRPGESAGGEAFPYCTANLKALAAPYTYAKQNDGPHPVGTYVGWLDYYKEMLQWGKSQTPYMNFFAPLNAADGNDLDYGYQEANAAAISSNGHGFIDGFGSQGLSLRDSLNGCTLSASNWCPSFGNWYTSAMPLELQQLSLSDERDSTCSSCGVPPGDSGDLRLWLPFAVNNHITILELYYLDAGLAYDQNYCTAISGLGVCTGYNPGSNTFLNTTIQATFMNHVGQGKNCPGGGPTYSNGNCSYAQCLNDAHGPHPRTQLSTSCMTQ